jgi:hypothetical protein
MRSATGGHLRVGEDQLAKVHEAAEFPEARVRDRGAAEVENLHGRRPSWPSYPIQLNMT